MIRVPPASANLGSVAARQGGRRQRLIGAAGVLGWFSFAFVTQFAITTGWRLLTDPLARHYDWHVYLAGARDLLDRSLYRVTLVLDGLPMPVTQFNYPPGSALLAAPLAWMDPPVGGMVWQVLSAGGLGLGAYLTAAVVGARPPWAWAGIVLGGYAWHESYRDGMISANNNFIMLALLAGFCLAYVRRSDGWAGALLAVAIGAKLWPIVLFVPALRDRRWTVIWLAGAGLAVQVTLMLAWLGADVVPHLVGALRYDVPSSPGVIGISALRRSVDWWPAWGGAAVAVTLLLLPMRGRAGLGVATLAGLAAIPNLWSHYLPIVVLALALIGADVVGRWRPGWSIGPGTARQLPPTADAN